MLVLWRYIISKDKGEKIRIKVELMKNWSVDRYICSHDD